MSDLLTALVVVFLAELGDKTQLVALGFGARQRLGPVLLGVALAYVATNLVSVVVGGLLGAALPTRAIGIGGGEIDQGRRVRLGILQQGLQGRPPIGPKVLPLVDDDRVVTEDGRSQSRSRRQRARAFCASFSMPLFDLGAPSHYAAYNKNSTLTASNGKMMRPSSV